VRLGVSIGYCDVPCHGLPSSPGNNNNNNKQGRGIVIVVIIIACRLEGGDNSLRCYEEEISCL